MINATAKWCTYWGTDVNGRQMWITGGQSIQLEPTNRKRKWFDGKIYGMYRAYVNGEFFGMVSAAAVNMEGDR